MLAPGVKGLVMSVFTLPSFPYVFKVIKDKFGPNKDFDQEYVRQKYLLVKAARPRGAHGRYAGVFQTWPCPKRAAMKNCLHEMRTLAPSQMEETDDWVIIKHVYIEYRLKPLNLFMQKAKPAEKAAAVIDYGYALKELASANIFPGDMLYKNFGMTRFGRVIFYDYDEIEYMTDCNFRAIPPAPNPEYEMSGEVWYPVHKGDVFPEEFGPFSWASRMCGKCLCSTTKICSRPNSGRAKKSGYCKGFMTTFTPIRNRRASRPTSSPKGWWTALMCSAALG
jgi:isocitrate dehydrogenase kinase/phosphatase